MILDELWKNEAPICQPVFQFDRLKSIRVIIFNVHLHFQEVGFFQVSPNSIPGSRDMRIRLIDEATPPPNDLYPSYDRILKNRLVTIWPRPRSFCQNFDFPTSELQQQPSQGPFFNLGSVSLTAT